MIVEALESYAKVTNPLAAGVERDECNEHQRYANRRWANGVGRADAPFLNQRLSAYASFDGRVEPLVQPSRQTDRAVRGRTMPRRFARSTRRGRTSLREDRPLTEAARFGGRRRGPSSAATNKGTARAKARREERAATKTRHRRGALRRRRVVACRPTGAPSRRAGPVIIENSE